MREPFSFNGEIKEVRSRTSVSPSNYTMSPLTARASFCRIYFSLSLALSYTYRRRARLQNYICKDCMSRRVHKLFQRKTFLSHLTINKTTDCFHPVGTKHFWGQQFICDGGRPAQRRNDVSPRFGVCNCEILYLYPTGLYVGKQVSKKSSLHSTIPYRCTYSTYSMLCYRWTPMYGKMYRIPYTQ